VQLTPLSTHWAPRKKNKKGVQSFSDTVYTNLPLNLTEAFIHIPDTDLFLRAESAQIWAVV